MPRGFFLTSSLLWDYLAKQYTRTQYSYFLELFLPKALKVNFAPSLHRWQRSYVRFCLRSQLKLTEPLQTFPSLPLLGTLHLSLQALYRFTNVSRVEEPRHILICHYITGINITEIHLKYTIDLVYFKQCVKFLLTCLFYILLKKKLLLSFLEFCFHFYTCINTHKYLLNTIHNPIYNRVMDRSILDKSDNLLYQCWL